MFRDYVIPGLRARAAGEPHDMASFQDGVAIARVIDAAQESQRTRAWVDVESS